MSLLVNPYIQVIDPATNYPVSGGKLFFFLSGTSTAVNVYSDSALTESLGNEITCDAYGRPETSIYLDPAKSYKLIVTAAAGDTGSPLYEPVDPYDPNGKAEAQFSAVSGASDTIEASDRGKIIRRTHSAAMSDTLPTAASVGNGYFVTIRNATSAYDITLSVTSAGTIDGASSLTIYPGQDRVLRSNGSVWYADVAPLSIGKRVYPFPAAAWKETATNGCAAIARAETTTNKVNYDYLAFDGSTKEYAYCVTTTPPSYLAGSMDFRVHWAAAAGTPGDIVKWSAYGLCRVDDAALDTAYGTPGLVDDTLLATGDIQASAWTAFVPAGDAAGALLMLRVDRDAANDTHASDAQLVCVEIRWSLAKPTDA